MAPSVNIGITREQNDEAQLPGEELFSNCNYFLGIKLKQKGSLFIPLIERKKRPKRANKGNHQLLGTERLSNNSPLCVMFYEYGGHARMFGQRTKVN